MKDQSSRKIYDKKPESIFYDLGSYCILSAVTYE